MKKLIGGIIIIRFVLTGFSNAISKGEVELDCLHTDVYRWWRANGLFCNQSHAEM